MDRAVGNTAWFHLFPNSLVTHGLLYKSDHRPIIVDLGLKVSRTLQDRLFRLQAACLSHDSFPQLVRESWTPGTNWSVGCEAFKSNAIKWNQNVFGNIFQRKRRVINRLKGIESSISRGDADDSLLFLRDELLKEYNDILR